ncbi:hypothetical protein [Haloarcula salina]|nr:hypothetical protein [Haloarcula salina]
MATNQRVQLPATDCPHCSGEFKASAPSISICDDCGYIPGQGAD